MLRKADVKFALSQGWPGNSTNGGLLNSSHVSLSTLWITIQSVLVQQ